MKRFLSILTALILVSACCFSVVAESPVSVDNLENITYNTKDIIGASSGNNAKVHIIEFNTSDYVPLAYSGNGGSVCLTQEHVDAAVKEGYDVLGAINGSFFEMSKGAPCGTLISDGKVVFTHVGLKNDPVVTFDQEGKCKIVSSTISISLRLDTKAVPVGIGLVNKIYDSISLFSISGGDNKFHYYDIDAGDISDENVKGYEIICEKDSTTELIIGKALKGKVLEVKDNSYYGATSVTKKNQFVLFLKSDATSVKKVTDLLADDKVEIEVKETGNKTSIEAMENAISAIGSAYWLVKDGKDLTDKAPTIVHSTTLPRAWTAFGVKEDGSYAFWVSSEVDANGENAVTLRDVADAMAEIGCTNVIRLDGGGSTSMFVKGYDMVMSTTRKVCDVLLIVDKDTLKYTELTSDSDDDGSQGGEESDIESSEPSIESETESSDIDNDGKTNDKSSFMPDSIGVIVLTITIAVVAIAVVVVIVVLVVKKKK